MNFPTEIQLMLPILKMMRDNKERHRSEIFDYLDEEFQFSEEVKSQRLASGGLKIENRKIWALANLKAARLLTSARRGYYKITEQGQEVLRENPTTISKEILLRYAPTDSAFFYPNKKKEEKSDGDQFQEQSPEEESDSSQTPLELIEKNYQLLRNNLSDELLENIKNNEPSFLEKLVVDLLPAMGYGGSRQETRKVIGASHDGGIDGIIKEDKLGLDIIYLQAKRYSDSSVGEGAIRNFVGALAAKHAQKGVFITTTSYTKSAREYVKQIPQKVILIDGDDLVNLMIDHDVGVSNVSKDTTFEIKKIDLDYFEQ